MKLLSFCNVVIRWSFYAIFFLIPLVFTGDTSELFEFNKLWMTFTLTIIIASCWITKMIAQKKIFIQCTLLDIPILLFLVSQIIATIFSLDSHISLWGFYSRFNGGLLSLLTYIFLYYALVSNVSFFKGKNTQESKRFVITGLHVSLISGLITSLWGLPSHFGYDPTCLIFRGTFDVSCWTAAFQPKVRIFSTLGQPDWFAAYLTILIPIAIIFCLYYAKQKKSTLAWYYFFLTLLFYIDFLYTRSKGSFVAFLISFAIFIFGYFYITKEKIKKSIFIMLFIGSFIGITFFLQTPLQQFNIFTFTQLQERILHPHYSQITVKTGANSNQTKNTTPTAGEFGGTDSGKIRLYVWKGAIDIWLHNPLFGTGVETFAYAYYKYRPKEHNMTSEWDFLYNKAHNEYLNYLATTGAFGLLTYLAIIIYFLFKTSETLLKKTSLQNQEKTFTLALFCSFLSIIISNFFGFSVVIINIYFFLILAFVLILSDQINPAFILKIPKSSKDETTTNPGQWIGFSVIWIICFYLIAVLINYWFADKAYGLGYNLDRVGQYQTAYDPLHQAVASRTDEPVFKDEMSINDAILATTLYTQKEATNGAKLAQEALDVNNDITTNYPNDVSYWKSRVRIAYTLSQIDPKYLTIAIDAITKAHELAPTDAKIDYNVGLLYGQANQLDKAVNALKETVNLKPDYKDAYYALGLFLHQQAIDKSNRIVNISKQQEALATMNYILSNLSPHDLDVLNTLKDWGKQ